MSNNPDFNERIRQEIETNSSECEDRHTQKCPQFVGHDSRHCHDDFIETLLERLCETYADGKGVNAASRVLLPSQGEVDDLTRELFEIMAPGYAEARRHSERSLRYALGDVLSRIDESLFKLISRSILHLCSRESVPCKACDVEEKADEIVRKFLMDLPGLREILKLDVDAAFDGDPAAATHDEVLVSYPGLRAVTVQRMAHRLHEYGVPFVPRMMTEYIHSRTGIDIHPGAELGRGIFIDHGTGVVIGETCIIGDQVKIYQGVTLGALSFPKDGCGKLIRGTKRHPTIEEGVTLYAGATVLGNVTVGRHSVIGGNVWLTHSVPENSKISTSPTHQTCSPGERH